MCCTTSIAKGRAQLKLRLNDGSQVNICPIQRKAERVLIEVFKRLALQMKKLGFQRVRPLAGGLNAWIDAGLPVVGRAVRPESRVAQAM